MLLEHLTRIKLLYTNLSSEKNYSTIQIIGKAKLVDESQCILDKFTSYIVKNLEQTPIKYRNLYLNTHSSFLIKKTQA